MTKCNLCRNIDSKIIYRVNTKTYSNKTQCYNLVKCKKCGLMYLNPMPTRKEINDMYSKDYFEFTEKGNFNEEGKKVINEETIKRYQSALSRIERYVIKGRLLELGCGFGGFLNEAKQRGWVVLGLEPSQDMYLYCKMRANLNVVNKTLEEARFKNGYFDAIYADNVIEHLLEPSLALKKLNKLIKKRGILYIRLPNENGLAPIISRTLMKIKTAIGAKNNVQLLQHLYYYDAKTINRMLEKNGFKIVLLRKLNSGITYNSSFVVRIITKFIFFIATILNQGNLFDIIAVKE